MRWDCAGELEAAQVRRLPVALTLQQLDEPRVFAVAQRFGMEREIDIGCADVLHLCFGQQEPRDGSADDGELALEAAERLADFD